MAEILRFTDKAASAIPRAASPATKASNAVALASPVTCAGLPTWNDAVVQTYVQQSVRQSVLQSMQTEVEPRIESLAERLAGVVATAQCELQEHRRLAERSEARVEGRISGLERRVSGLVEGAARAEQRERDLNKRIADLADGWLKGTDEAASHEAAHAPRIGELERFMRDIGPRIGSLENNSHRDGPRQRAVEERVRDLDQRLRAAARLGDELRELLGSRREMELAAASAGEECEARVAALERRVASLSSAAPSAPASAGEVPGSCQLAVLEGKLESHRLEFDSLAAQLLSQGKELQDRIADQARRHDEQRTEARTMNERQRALTSRVEEFGQNVGALRTRTDGLETRMLKAAERSEAACKPLEAQLKNQLEDQRRWLAGETETRLELLERRLEAVRQLCEDAAEEAASRQATPRHGGGERSARSQDRAAGPAAGGSSSRPPRPQRGEPESLLRRGPSPRPGAERDRRGGG